jgi:biopolymer transport protein ExbD
MSASVHSGERAEPNLVPILDMVFQLITFFMLVINFKQQDVDMSLKLPVVGSSRPVDTKGQGELLILNINPLGQVVVQGHVQHDVAKFISTEAQLLARRAEDSKSPDAKPGENPVTVVIRADKTTTFGLLNQVVQICQAQGYRKFDFMVLRQAAEGGGGN